MQPNPVLLFDAKSEIVWISGVHHGFSQKPGEVEGLTIRQRCDNAEEMEAAFTEALLRQVPVECPVEITAGHPPTTQKYMARLEPIDLDRQAAVIALAHVIPSDLERLTARELEVLTLVAEDHPTREIAEKLRIAISTAESYIQNLKAKLGCRGIAGLTRFAIASSLA